MAPPFLTRVASRAFQEAGGSCVRRGCYNLNAREERVNWGLCRRGKGVGERR